MTEMYFKLCSVIDLIIYEDMSELSELLHS